MRRTKHQVTSGEDLFVGIDLHKIRWHVTIRDDGPGVVQRQHSRDMGSSAPRFGPICLPSSGGGLWSRIFWVPAHDRLVDHGIPRLVTPPSLVPQEYGNRVKTDRRDTRKLAHLLAKGMNGSGFAVRRNATIVRWCAGVGNCSETECGLRAASRRS